MTSLLLICLVAVPALGAAVAGCSGRRPDVAAAVATMSACVSVVLSVGLVALTRPWSSGDDVAQLSAPWIGWLGARIHLGLDGISAPLVVLTCVLSALACWYLWAGSDDAQPGETEGRPPPAGLLCCLLATQAGAVLTFLARDLIVFFVGFETVLIPMWVLIGRWGGSPDDGPAQLAEKRSAATRFVLYTALGSAIMLVGILWLAIESGSTDFGVVALVAPHLSTGLQAGIASLLIIGLGVKVPIWPLHSWLPPAHTLAPTVGSVLLAGVLLKLGSYGLVRLVAGFLPLGVGRLALPLGVLGVVGIVWGGLVCLVERDLKRLIAFSSVAHMGFVVLGVASGTREGLQGALFVGVAHGVVTSLLFWVVGMIKHRHLAQRPADLTQLPAGLRDSHPRLGWMLALGAAAGAGLPGLAGFWGEVLTLLGTWRGPNTEGMGLGAAGPWLALAAALGALLAAGYLFRVLYLIWHGQAPALEAVSTAHAQATSGNASAGPTSAVLSGAPHSAPDAGKDLSRVELTVLAPLVVATIGFGVQPWLLLSLTGPAVRMLGVGS